MDLNSGHRKRVKDRYLKLPIRSVEDYELLELILFGVFKQKDTKPIAKALMHKFKNIVSLINASDKELKTVEGVGDGVVLQLKIMKDLFSRLILDTKIDESIMDNWMSVVKYCTLSMGFSKKEIFKVMFLNSKNRLIKDHNFESGTVDKIAVYPREVVQMALDNQATSVILAHNHPSGFYEPSKEDISLTKDIVSALKTVSISVHDHLIVSRSGNYSFRARGLL